MTFFDVLGKLLPWLAAASIGALIWALRLEGLVKILQQNINRLETRLDGEMIRLESRIATEDNKLATRMEANNSSVIAAIDKVEGKVDGLITFLMGRKNGVT